MRVSTVLHCWKERTFHKLPESKQYKATFVRATALSVGGTSAFLFRESTF
jgi:hypothetical protein